MHVLNIHERRLAVSAERVGALLDRLASREDVLWPGRHWPRMRLDGPLAVGARGGHGPIRYVVDEYAPGVSVWFRFEGPRGFDGRHGLEVVSDGPEACVLRHTIRMQTHGWAQVSWTLLFRPLHDALLEDALTMAERAVGLPERPVGWSLWVRLLRGALKRLGT